MFHAGTTTPNSENSIQIYSKFLIQIPPKKTTRHTLAHQSDVFHKPPHTRPHTTLQIYKPADTTNERSTHARVAHQTVCRLGVCCSIGVAGIPTQEGLSLSLNRRKRLSCLSSFLERI